MIEERPRAIHRSLEEAARLSGMEISMTNHATAALFGILTAGGIGLIGGCAIGDLMRTYRQGAEQLDALRRQLPQPYSAVLFQQRQLRELRGVVNDIHRMVRAITKPSKNRPPKPHKINGRISSIRPFLKVWVQKHEPKIIGRDPC
jgi:hypothetical protein